MPVYRLKTDYLDIVTDLEYLIKPDSCPDWAMSLEVLYKDSDKNFVYPFMHFRLFHRELEEDPLIFVEITVNSGDFLMHQSGIQVLQECLHAPTLRLNYGVPSETNEKSANVFRAIDFSGLRKIAFHCSMEHDRRYTSVLYLTFEDAAVAVDKGD